MQARQKRFLWVAAPFFVMVVAASLISVGASVLLTLGGLVAFSWFYSRPTGRSLALSPCALCSRTIVFEHQGEFCASCAAPLHAKCIDEHRMAAHAPAKHHPFR